MNAKLKYFKQYDVATNIEMELDALKNPAGGKGDDDDDEGDKYFFKHRKTGELKAFINKLKENGEITDAEYDAIGDKRARSNLLEYCNKNWSKENYNETMEIDEFPAGYGQDNWPYNIVGSYKILGSYKIVGSYKNC